MIYKIDLETVMQSYYVQKGTIFAILSILYWVRLETAIFAFGKKIL